MARLQVLIAFCVCCMATGFGAEIRLVDQIAVQPPTVTLGQISVIETSDAELKRRLLNLEVIEAPRMGMTRTISAYKVKARLREEGLGDVLVRGMQSTVSLETRTLSEQDLDPVVTQWVLSNSESTDSIEVNVLRLPHEWKVPAGNGVSIEVENPREQMVGNLTLTLRAVVNGSVLSTQMAYVHVAAYKEMPVIVRAVRRSEVIENHHIEMQRVEVTSASGMEVVSLAEIIGMSAKRQMPVGYMPKATDLSRPILIERGDQAAIVVANGPIKMKVSGAIALQDGREGELIQFKNPMNNAKPLRARVLRHGMAVMKVQ